MSNSKWFIIQYMNRYIWVQRSNSITHLENSQNERNSKKNAYCLTFFYGQARSGASHCLIKTDHSQLIISKLFVYLLALTVHQIVHFSFLFLLEYFSIFAEVQINI